MLTTNTRLRAAAVAAVTAIITAGAIGPAVACDHGSGHRGASASGHHAQTGGTERSHGSDQTRGDHGTSDHAGRSGNDAARDQGDQDQQRHQEHQDTGNQGEGHETHGTRADHQVRQGGGHGHQPVTVCHLLGNGGYHLLTFDKHALKAHLHHGDLYPVPADGCPTTADQGGTASGKDHEHGHQRVTVCHLLGNGGYHLLTFDEHALKAHLHHGDLYPVPVDGCPAPGTPAGTTQGGTDTGAIPDAPGGTSTVPGVTLPGGSTTGPATGSAEVLGVQEIRPSSAPTVLGTQAVRSTGPAPTVNTAARVAPSAGLLPNTGAGAMTLPLLGGLGLVGAGAALVARRRTRTDS